MGGGPKVDPGASQADQNLNREADQEVKDRLRDNHCVQCNTKPVDLHHVLSRGAGGTDALYNLIPLCRSCHGALHHFGQLKMFLEKDRFRKSLEERGWYYLEVNGKRKLWNDFLNKD